ncbi:TolB family protein [Kribbella kalugense]|uniref:WD40 repeat protein n=1 Tax=Kribbella kalugense TaxID=2512221 RepID=A0A4R8A1E5_9ACTN|nr:PD40 domain-containing protein [Kribbella kalugense]TDW23391.1 WD40 repeat protein [Kribbella kalugense]
MKRVLAVSISLMLALCGSSAPHSNDGRIVFSRQLESGGANLFVARADGSGVRKVPMPELVEDFGSGRWSPDGSKLLISNLLRFDAAGELLPFRPATVRPDGSGFRMLEPPGAPDDMLCGAWSPDGKRILCGFGGDKPGVFSIRSSDGGRPIRLTTNPYGGSDVAGDYSPDGDQAVIVRFRGEDTALFVVDTDGRHLRQLTPYGLAQGHELATARWSPDGRSILFATAEGGLSLIRLKDARLTSITLDTGGKAYHAFAPGWSPDGSRIVVSLTIDQQEDIYTARRDGTHLQRITNTPDFEPFADWGF